jgi:2,4-dienoyl-CoA reductase-like NADH-dependent reductase (Old Yellow Enzyme family)
MNAGSVVLDPLRFRNLTVKNRLFRSSLSGRFDNYDGSGGETRIRWDVRFARAGIGAIISSNSPVHPRGLIVPGYAGIDRDERIPFWRELVARVHEHDCRYIVQIAFSGRQRDIGGIEYATGLSSTAKPEPLHGFPCERMTVDQIREVVAAFGRAAYRAREAGADGVEVHGCNGYLITQFLSSEINDRKDDYGGALENRARFALEIVRAIRKEAGPDYHVQFKISALEYHNELLPWHGKGNTLEESVQVCRWLEEAGVDAIHVSSGGAFPHPRNPAGAGPVKELVRTYDVMLSSGRYTFRNYLLFRLWPTSRIFKWWWERPGKSGVEGINRPAARAVKEAVSVPVICAGGFQTQSVIGEAVSSGDCDAVSIGRPLLANPDLPLLFAQGHDSAPRPCTYCNKCLVTFVEHPLGCYEESRYSSRDEMIREVLAAYEATPDAAGATP